MQLLSAPQLLKKKKKKILIKSFLFVNLYIFDSSYTFQFKVCLSLINLTLASANEK